MNFTLMSSQAQQRAGKKVLVTSKRPVSTVMNEAMVPDISDCPNTVSGYVDQAVLTLSLFVCISHID